MLVKKNASIEQLLQNNYKNVSQPKDVNKNTDTPNTAPAKSKISHHWPKANLVRFEDPYDHINPMKNTHEDTHTIDTREKNIEDADADSEQ